MNSENPLEKLKTIKDELVKQQEDLEPGVSPYAEKAKEYLGEYKKELGRVWESFEKDKQLEILGLYKTLEKLSETKPTSKEEEKHLMSKIDETLGKLDAQKGRQSEDLKKEPEPAEILPESKEKIDRSPKPNPERIASQEQSIQHETQLEGEFDINSVESCDQLLRGVVQMFADVRRIREKLGYDYRDVKDRRTSEVKGNFPFQMAVAAFKKHYREAIEKFNRGEEPSLEEKEDFIGVYNNLVHLYQLVLDDAQEKGLSLNFNGEGSKYLTTAKLEQAEDRWRIGSSRPPEDWEEDEVKRRYRGRVQKQHLTGQRSGYDKDMKNSPESAAGERKTDDIELSAEDKRQREQFRTREIVKFNRLKHEVDRVVKRLMEKGVDLHTTRDGQKLEDSLRAIESLINGHYTTDEEVSLTEQINDLTGKLFSWLDELDIGGPNKEDVTGIETDGSDDETVEATERIKALLIRVDDMKELAERDQFLSQARENVDALLEVAEQYESKLEKVQLDSSTLQALSADLKDLADSAESYLNTYENSDDPGTGRGRRIFLRMYKDLGEVVNEFVEEVNNTLSQEQTLASELEEELKQEDFTIEKEDPKPAPTEINKETEQDHESTNKFAIREKIRADYKDWLSAKREFEQAEQAAYAKNKGIRKFFGLRPKELEADIAASKQRYIEARAKYCENLNRELPNYLRPDGQDVHQLEAWAQKTRAKLFEKFVQRPVNERLTRQQEAALDGKGKQWAENLKEWTKNHRKTMLIGAATVFGTTAVMTGGASLIPAGAGIVSGLTARFGANWALTRYLVANKEQSLNETVARGARSFNSGSIDKLESDILSDTAAVEKARKIRAYGSRAAGIAAAAAAGYGVRTFGSESVVAPATSPESPPDVMPKSTQTGDRVFDRFSATDVEDIKTPLSSPSDTMSESSRLDAGVDKDLIARLAKPDESASGSLGGYPSRSQPGVPEVSPETEVSPEVAPRGKYEHPPLEDPRGKPHIENDATGSDYIQRMIEKHHGPQNYNVEAEPLTDLPKYQEVAGEGSKLDSFGHGEAEPLIEEPRYWFQSDDSFEKIVAGRSQAGTLPTTDFLQERYHQAYTNELANVSKKIAGSDTGLSNLLGFGSDVNEVGPDGAARLDYMEYLTNKVARRIGLDVPDTTGRLDMQDFDKQFIDERIDRWFAKHGEGRLLVPEPRSNVVPESMIDNTIETQGSLEQEWEPEDGPQPGAGEELEGMDLSTQELAESNQFFMETVKGINENPNYLAKSGDSFYEIGAGESEVGYPPTTDWLHDNNPERIKELMDDSIKTANRDTLLLRSLGFGSTVNELKVGSAINMPLMERLLNEVARAKGMDVPDTSEMVPIAEAMADRIKQLVDAMNFGGKTNSVPGYIPETPMPPNGRYPDGSIGI